MIGIEPLGGKAALTLIENPYFRGAGDAAIHPIEEMRNHIAPDMRMGLRRGWHQAHDDKQENAGTDHARCLARLPPAPEVLKDYEPFMAATKRPILCLNSSR